MERRQYVSNSSLVNYTLLSPNNSGRRWYPITKITIHHMAGNLSVEQCGRLFQNRAMQGSSNYGIGTDGRVGQYVDEANRSWCSANADNDNRAITIEVANDEIGGNWHVSDTALEKCIELCVDICKRNGISQINYTGNIYGNLTMHCWFAQTACPGPYLKSKFPYIAEQINARLAAGTVTPEPAAPSTPATPTQAKSVHQIALEVVAGVWGNGSARIANLTQAGYDAKVVQAEVDKIVHYNKITVIAKQVVAGRWGNGWVRKWRLTRAGYSYTEVQGAVQQVLKGTR